MMEGSLNISISVWPCFGFSLFLPKQSGHLPTTYMYCLARPVQHRCLYKIQVLHEIQMRLQTTQKKPSSNQISNAILQNTYAPITIVPLCSLHLSHPLKTPYRTPPYAWHRLSQHPARASPL